MPNDQRPSPDIYPVFSYRDGRAAIDWVARAFGFKSHFEVPAADGEINHAELRFGNGRIMCSGTRKADPADPWSTEKSGIYVAVDDIDGHYARAQAAGADIVRPLTDTGYGSREYSARDLDGYLWSFGTYRP